MAQQINVPQSGGELQWPLGLQALAANQATGGAGLATVVTVTADANSPIYLSQIDFSYTAAPTGGSLKVEDGAGTTVWGPHPITTAGLQTKTFSPPLYGTKNTALVVTLAAPGGAVVGQLSLNCWSQL